MCVRWLQTLLNFIPRPAPGGARVIVMDDYLDRQDGCASLTRMRVDSTSARARSTTTHVLTSEPRRADDLEVKSIAVDLF